MRNKTVEQKGNNWWVDCPRCFDTCCVTKGVRNISCSCGYDFEITDEDLRESGLLEEEENEEEN